MGKQEEIRCLDVEGWWSRQSFGCAYNYSSDWECLVRLNQLIVDADRLLYGHNEIYPMYYESKEKKIEELGDNFTIYLKYVDNLPNDIKAIDHAFYVDITSNAVQDLSEIKQEKYSVQEGVLAEKYGGVTLEDYVVGQRVHYYRTLGRQTIELVELQEFSEMLQSNFQEQAQANGMETEEYILQMLEDGEYDHQAYHPGEDFVSGLLDTGSLGVKPLLEIMAGHDFVTGEEMTETLKKEKSFEVIMGMIAILGAPSTKIGSQGKRGIVTQLGIEMATGAVGYTIYETGEAIDLPPGLTMVATLAGGALTYRFLEGRILRVGVAEGVSASALDSLDDGLKSGDDIVDRPIKDSSDNVAYHSVGGDNSAKKIQSVLNGIDISYTSPESRFGQGFYVAADGKTTVAELAYHGTDAKYSIRYDMNLEGQKVLDLTDPKIASEWGFLKGESSLLECQNIAEKALDEGYNVIKVHSYRDAGINYVIYDNFDEILRPQMVTPIGD